MSVPLIIFPPNILFIGKFTNYVAVNGSRANDSSASYISIISVQHLRDSFSFRNR